MANEDLERFKGLVWFLVNGTAGDNDLQIKVAKLQKSYDKKMKESK